MRIVIPLPWYSRAVYDITRDEHRGGWRRIHIHVVAGRHPSFLPSFAGFSIGLALMVCIGTKFTRDAALIPEFERGYGPKRWYQTLWEHLR